MIYIIQHKQFEKENAMFLIHMVTTISEIIYIHTGHENSRAALDMKILKFTVSFNPFFFANV